jgi:ribosomal protein L37AE/L43A
MVDLKIRYKNRKRDQFKDISKEERAKKLDNIICPRCKYQNHRVHILKYGTCNLCGATLDKDYFKKMMLRKMEGK